MPDPAASMYAALAELEQAGGVGVLCTIIRERGSVPRHVGSKMLVYGDGRLLGTVGGGEMESRVVAAALEAAGDGQPRTVRYELVDPKAGDPGICGGEVDIFIEPVRPAAVLLVIGAGHVGRALVHLGKWLGYRVVLADDRAEYCRPEWAPGADEYLPMAAGALSGLFRFTSETYIVMPTRGAPVDVEALPHLLEQPHAYLGVIGSRRRWATARRLLEERGVPAEKLDRIHAPMGLELNAETPEEIAVSVMAEITMLRRRGTGVPMNPVEKQLAGPGSISDATPA
jgi:xanthine dehydrogenase accessory factor